MRFASQQATRLRGEVDLAIGVMEGDDPYLFANVEALTWDSGGRIYIADSGTLEVRVFGPSGEYLFDVGGPGEGPGEFPGSQICGLAFDSEGRLWVNSRDAYKVFSIVGNTASYETSVRVPGENSTVCANPMFGGPTGLTLVGWGTIRDGTILREHLRVSPAGEVRARIPIVHVPPDWGEWRWPSFEWRGRDIQREPPFAAREISAHAPNGDAAYVFTPEYNVQLFNADGRLVAQIQRDAVGPLLTETEVRVADEQLREIYEWARQMGMGFREDRVRVPERKPVIVRMWYDEDGRLWVMPWPAEGDASWQAHVYDSDGVQLHTAEWPAGITLSRGGGRGNVALGVQAMAFDVERVVRLRFAPVEQGTGEV
jgi:hypothetical protein